MSGEISLIATAPVSLKGAEGVQLAGDDEVYTWDAAAAAYGPQPALERLITHDVTGASSFELVFHTDGSVVWH